MSLFTFGFVPGSESLSFPFSVVITVPFASISSVIQATFVNISPFTVSTVHSISIVSDDKFSPSYSFKLFSVFLISVTWFVSSSYCGVYPDVFTFENFNPVGSWSIIFLALLIDSLIETNLGMPFIYLLNKLFRTKYPKQIQQVN